MNIYNIVSLGISTISIIFCILTFARNGKKDEKKEVSDDSYKWGRLDERLDNFETQLNKILNILDGYDKEIDIKIEKAIEQHIAVYHREK